jgi:hypothetical protein
MVDRTCGEGLLNRLLAAVYQRVRRLTAVKNKLVTEL